MKHAALVLVAWLLLPLPLAAQGPIVVPGTADAPDWDLLLPPRNPWDTTAPLSQWIKAQTFTSEEECHARANGGVFHHYPTYGPVPYGDVILAEKNVLCVAADDPRLKGSQ